MSNLKKVNRAYFRLFSRISELLLLLERQVASGDLPIEAVRAIGIVIEELKDAQDDSAEIWIGK